MISDDDACLLRGSAGGCGENGWSRHSWLACVAALVAIFAGSALAAGPEALPVASGGGQHLTDAISLSVDPARKTRTLKLGNTSITLQAGQSVYYAGGTVSLVTATADSTEVRLHDGQGRLLRTVTLPPGVKTTAFGETVVSYAPNLHAPGIPYSFAINSPTGTFHLERKGRTVTDLRALESHLVISSRDADGEYVTEVVNGRGTVDWRFSEPRRRHPRVAVQGNRAVAIFTGRPDSVLQFAATRNAAPRRLPLSGAVLTNVAFIADRPDVFAWGLHDAALVDPVALKPRWQRHFRTDQQQLSNGTSVVAAVDKLIPTVTRQETADGKWRVGLDFLSLADGSVVRHQALHETGSPPAWVRRIQRGTREILVMPNRVYTIAPSQEGER